MPPMEDGRRPCGPNGSATAAGTDAQLLKLENEQLRADLWRAALQILKLKQTVRFYEIEQRTNEREARRNRPETGVH